MRILFAFLLLGLAAPAAAQAPQASSPEARRAIENFGQCVADRSPKEAERVLNMDFRKDTYRTALRLLGEDAERACANKAFGVGKMRSSGLLFAGALAERLMAHDSAPLNARLAKAASLPAPPARSPSDGIAMCVARSAPDETARLFAAEVSSEAEAEAVKSLDVVVQLCSRGQAQLQTNTEGLRAMLATAAFRNVVALAERK